MTQKKLYDEKNNQKSKAEGETESIKTKVIIIILNWNGKAHTIECVQSVNKIQYSNYDIVLVDNNSDDDSVEILRRKFPQIKIIENPENYGVAGGRNIGVDYALEQGAGYILIIDNDIVVDRRFLAELVKVCQADACIGITGPLIYYYEEPDRVQSLGMKISCREHLSHHIVSHKRTSKMEMPFKVKEVPVIMGACMLVRREVFKDIGRFALEYSVYGGEDVDFCYRAKLRGYKVVNVPSSKIWHKTFQSSGGGYSPRRKYFSARGYVVFMKKYGRPYQWATFFLFNTCGLFWAFLKEGLRGNHKAVFYKAKGIYDGLLNKTIPDLNFQ